MLSSERKNFAGLVLVTLIFDPGLHARPLIQAFLVRKFARHSERCLLGFGNVGLDKHAELFRACLRQLFRVAKLLPIDFRFCAISRRDEES